MRDTMNSDAEFLAVRAWKYYLPILALFVLFPLALAAQTPVAIVNPSFGSAVTFTATNVNGSYEVGIVPGWTGSWGVWKPNANEYATLPDGAQVLFSAGGVETQDLGPQQVGTYTLTIQQGNRGDGIANGASCTVSLGTAAVTTPNSGILLGTWQAVTLHYTGTTGDLMLSLSATGGQCNFDNVSLTFTLPGPPPPFVWVMPGLGTATFPMQIPPACSPSDGACSIKIQIVMPPAAVCTIDATGTQTCTAGIGQLNLIKTVSLPTPQVQTIPVVTVTSP